MNENEKSSRQKAREKKSVIGALFSLGDKESAMALMFGKITMEQAIERLRR